MVKILGSFWFLVKAVSSLFMKERNSALGNLGLFLSFPLYFWKTAIRDSMYLSVSVGFFAKLRSEVRL